MSDEEVVIKVSNLSKCYQIYEKPHDRLKQSVYPQLQRFIGRQPKQYFREFWALKGVSFKLNKGEALGIIGRNGSGKSTLLQILAGTLAQTNGESYVNGRVAALLELGSGFNPDFTGKENVFLNAHILGFSQKEIESRYEQIVEFADIGDFIDQPVKTYSSGMFLRLAFSVQAHIDASVVIIDEALAVGDVFFRQKCYARLDQLRSSGAAILLVSHAMTDIEQFCDRAILLDHGSPQFLGPSSEASKHYYLLHQAQNTKDATQLSASFNTPTLNQLDYEVNYPPAEAFIDLTRKSQITNGQARCNGVALCNVAGHACNSFRQGDTAIFYYEFELYEAINVPICGIVISNDRGLIVHGKNSLQYNDVSISLGSGTRVQCRQEINLDLGLGEYVFEIGLASVSESVWQQREHLSDGELFIKSTRICSIVDVSSFSIGHALRNGVSVLTHHGITNLSGKIQIITKDSVQHKENFFNANDSETLESLIK